MVTAGECFGSFHVNRREQRLLRGNQPIELRPKAWDLLLYMLDHPNELLPFGDLQDALWPDVIVAPHALTKLISELRSALGDEGRTLIENVPRRGYRFLRSATDTLPSPTSAPKVSTSRSSPDDVFVAREFELDEIARAWEKAEGGHRQFVFVSGEPGIGKTTLIDEFVRLSQASMTTGTRLPFLVARGQCLPLETEPAPYAPALEALQRLVVERDVLDLLRQYAPAWLVQLPGALSPGERANLSSNLTGSGPLRMINEGALFLEAVTAKIPLILIIEDAHWCDGATLDFLRTLLLRREPARLLVLVSYRPADIALGRHPLHSIVQTLPRVPSGRRLTLGPLPSDSVREYLERRFASAPPADLVDELEEISGGNPLFLNLFVTHLLERGQLDPASGRWTDSSSRAAALRETPPSLRELIEAELLSAAAEQMELLEAASLASDPIDAAVLAGATDHPIEHVDQVLFDLARKRHVLQFAAEGEGSKYQMVHALYRQILSERIAPARARHLHRRIGEYLESISTDNPILHAPALAHHFRAAGDAPRTAKYLELAALHSFQRFAYRESCETLWRAIEAIQSLPDSPEKAQREATRLLEFANLQFVTFGNDESRARGAYLRTLDLANRTGAPILAFRAKLGMCFHSAMLGHEEAISIANDLIATADQGQPGLTAAAHAYAALVRYMRGEPATALAHCKVVEDNLSIALPGVPASIDLQTRNHVFRSAILVALARPDEARAEHQRALERATALKSPIDLIETLYWRIHECVLEDDVDGLRLILERALELATTYGVQQSIEIGRFWQAWARFHSGEGSLGDVEEAAVFARANRQWTRELVHLRLADSYRYHQDFDAALKILVESAPYSWRYLEPLRWQILGDILDDGGIRLRGRELFGVADLDAAKCYQVGLQIARQRGIRLWEEKLLSKTSSPKTRRR